MKSVNRVFMSLGCAMLAISGCGGAASSNVGPSGTGGRANGPGGATGTGGISTSIGTGGSTMPVGTGGLGTGGAAMTGSGGRGGTGGVPGTAGNKGAGGVIGGLAADPFPFRPAFMMGADISWTQQDEAAGWVYSDGGAVKPLEQIMADNGFNYIRLRTFVNPQAPGGYSREGFADAAHTVSFAQRVKRCGMGIFLDFHMSDTWASIGSQIVPSAWAGMAPAQMQAAAHDYVKSVLALMVAGGVEPDMVQIGNETNSAMSGVSISNWANFSGLVNAGVRAVRETDPRIIVVVQHGRPRPDGNFIPWVRQYLGVTDSPKIDLDVICGSTYGTTNNGADWQDQFGQVVNTYKTPVASCEYAEDHSSLINPIMHGFPNRMGLGSFIWEPTRFGTAPLFDPVGKTYATNARMTTYPPLARSYGLPVPSGTCN